MLQRRVGSLETMINFNMNMIGSQEQPMSAMSYSFFTRTTQVCAAKLGHMYLQYQSPRWPFGGCRKHPQRNSNCDKHNALPKLYEK